MKATNIVLSILILVLALVSAVFSYFLFERRDTMIQGWGKLATAIQTTSRNLDKNSGTNTAAKLAPADLSPEKYGELDGKLQMLSAQSRQIVAERDELADALRRIGLAINVRDLGTEAEFRNVKTYSAKKDAVLRGVTESLRRRDAVYSALARDARRLNVNLNPKRIADSGPAALAPFSSAINSMRDRRLHYERTLKLIGDNVNVSVPEFGESDYVRSAAKVKDGVVTFRNTYDSKNSELDAVRRELKAANAGLKEANARIAGLKDLVAKKDYTINSYKTALGVPVDQPAPAPWLPGSSEVRAKTVGEVVKVSSDYGYIVINLGKNSTVRQSLGSKSITVNPKLERGMEMVVARGKLGGSAAFVARIKLDEIGEDVSTANIPAGVRNIKVGDIVYFDKAALK